MPKTHFPRIIHRIWLGPPIPQRMNEFWETWQRLNPGWECRTWTEAEVEPLVDSLGLAAVYAWVERPVAKSDLARLAILWRFGGLYVDVDMECLKPIEPLVLSWERAGYRAVMSEQSHRPKQPRIIGNAISLFEPRHEAVKWMMVECQKRLAAAAPNRNPHVTNTTGPFVWKAAAEAHEGSVYVAPKHIFQPLDDQLLDKRINMSRLPIGAVIPSISYAVHHSASLWGPQPWHDSSSAASPVVAAFVPTVRPNLLKVFLNSWRASPKTDGIRLYLHAQREPREDFERLYGVEVSGATYASKGGPVLPTRVAGMLAHPDVDVWINLDDDMELLPDLTDWWPAVERAQQPGVGVVSCNWARSEKFIKHRWPPRGGLWQKQPIVNMSGGQVYHRRIAELLGQIGAPGPVTPYLFDDVQVGLTAYINGYENYRFRGSLLIHRILSPKGVKVLFNERSWPLPDPTLLMTKPSLDGYEGAASRNNVHIPSSSDLLPRAHEMHRQNRSRLGLVEGGPA